MSQQQYGAGSALLGVNDVLQARANVALAQGREAEARAARLQRRDDLADVVADQAETRVPRVLLNHCMHCPAQTFLSAGKGGYIHMHPNPVAGEQPGCLHMYARFAVRQESWHRV